MSADDSTNPEVRGGTPMADNKPSADTARADTSTDDALREAVKDLNRSCGPRTVEALIGLLRSFNMAVPRRIAGRPVLAFIRYGQAEGATRGRGVAITADCSRRTGRYHVHTVFWDEFSSRWEGNNGRYDMTWEAARAELNRRADTETQP